MFLGSYIRIVIYSFIAGTVYSCLLCNLGGKSATERIIRNEAGFGLIFV